MSPPSSPSTPTPYYTVVGSSVDRVVATDGLDDHSWTNYAGSYYWSYATASTSTSVPKTPKSGGGLMGLGKSLTRKVSSRWRKTGGVVTTEGRGEGSSLASAGIKSAAPLPSAGPSTPAQDTQGFPRRSGSAGPEEPAKSPLQVGKERIKKMRSRYSISITVDPKSADSKTPVSPSPATPTPDTPTSIDSVRVPRRLIKPRPSLSADPSPSRAPSTSTPSSVSRSISTPVSEKTGSAKLWKLMKRISTGGLRDKYHTHSSSKSHLPNHSEESLSRTSSSAHGPTPPVPALPKGFRTRLPAGSSPASPISVSSDGGNSPRASGLPNTSSDIQLYINQTRTPEKDRCASSYAPIPSSSSSPASGQKKLLHRLRATSSVGALRRRPSTSSGVSASVSASISEQGLIRSSTPSGQTRPQIPSRPSTANATSSSPEHRFFNSSIIGRSRSMRSKRSSISSIDGENGHPQHLFQPLPPPNQQPNQPQQQTHQPQSQNNTKYNTNTNSTVPVPPMPTNILAKHIVPPGELLKEPDYANTQDNEQETRKKEQEGSLTGVVTGSGNANGTLASGYPSSHINGLTRGRPSKVGLYLELPSRSATSPLPRMNDMDHNKPAGSVRVPVGPMPSPGRSASLGGFEWSMARSPEYELPSLPVPPRKRVVEKVERGDGGVDVNAGEKVLVTRGRSSTSAASVSPPSPSRVFSTSSPPRTVESPSSLSSSGAGSAEYFTPALSTFGRVVGKQFGMERIEEPSFIPASTPGSASSVSSSFASTAAVSSSSSSRRKRNRRMSISESISHFLSISSSSSSRPGGSSSAATVARSYSSPSSCSEVPLSAQSQPSLPLPSSKRSPSISTSTPVGTFSTLLRKLSFSSGASTLPPMRPARSPRRPSTSAILNIKDAKKDEKEKANNTGGAKVLRKASLKGAGSGKGISNESNGGAVRNGEAEGGISNRHPYQRHKESDSLTEKEKRERWKDLLARSERAGGTIHLNANGEGLLSDRMSARASSAASLVTGEFDFEEQVAAAALDEHEEEGRKENLEGSDAHSVA